VGHVALATLPSCALSAGKIPTPKTRTYYCDVPKGNNRSLLKTRPRFLGGAFCVYKNKITFAKQTISSPLCVSMQGCYISPADPARRPSNTIKINNYAGKAFTLALRVRLLYAPVQPD
ncbi:MAG: hypothetical protein SH848_01045, partial [Saprospiraceae bacterium]|nr:hypothetical protein [Saprospiraceae bacterium]MDZ4702481.1 hypothetical protein [Saprospiraceae bacterium]